MSTTKSASGKAAPKKRGADTKAPKKTRAPGAGRPVGDGVEDTERRQVMLDENSETILKQIGGGQLSLGVREAARRLAEHGDIEKFTRERHEARAAQQLTQALHVKPK